MIMAFTFDRSYFDFAEMTPVKHKCHLTTVNIFAQNETFYGSSKSTTDNSVTGIAV